MQKSFSLRDQKRVHEACVATLPAETRASDKAKVQRWLGEAGAGSEASVMLGRALASLG